MNLVILSQDKKFHQYAAPGCHASVDLKTPGNRVVDNNILSITTKELGKLKFKCIGKTSMDSGYISDTNSLQVMCAKENMFDGNV